MRALTGLAAAAMLLGGCQTAFVGPAPSGRFALVEVNGRALPYRVDPANHCPVRIDGGHFELDSVARRFEIVLERSGPCAGLAADTIERGSYLRRGGRLDLEIEAPGGARRELVASESGGAISLSYDRLRLRFRQSARSR
ncbi:MAG: hypothetical protein QOC65_1600 [Sphingomonadales bacterium]|nr:hypothetical protein [Sphingomonadales bacterium]